MDVFQMVKALRTSKPNAVPTVVSKLVLKVNVCCYIPHFHRRIMRLCTMPCSLFWTRLIHTLIFRMWFELYSHNIMLANYCIAGCVTGEPDLSKRIKPYSVILAKIR